MRGKVHYQKGKSKLTRLSILILALASIINISFAQVPGTANIFPPNGGFAIDGNLDATAEIGDWLQGSAETGGFVINPDGSPVNPYMTFSLSDAFDPQPDDVFKSGKIYDNPNSMHWEMQKATGKSDINRAFLHLTVDAATGDKWAIFSADRRVANGVSYLDFEFLQNTVTMNSDGTFSTSGPHGGRTIGDFVVTATFGNGSTTFKIWTWQEISAGHYTYIEYTGDLTSIAYAAENTSTINPPYPVFDEDEYPDNTFVEGAINLSSFIGITMPCMNTAINTLFVKSKVSPALEANIQDFIAPIQLQSLIIGSTNAGEDQALCSQGEYTTFSVSGTANAVMGYTIESVLWEVQSYTGSQEPVILNPTQLNTDIQVFEGSAVIKFTAISTNGETPCLSSDELTLSVNPKPTATWVEFPADYSVDCAQAYSITSSELGYSNGVTGQCELSGSVMGVISGSFNECGGTLFQTWSYTDPWGVTISHIQTITSTPSLLASFTNIPSDITISCDEAATFTASDLNYTNGGLGGCLIEGSATGVVTGEYTECGGEMSQTWTFTDDCGRTINHTQVITVLSAPQATFISQPEDISISCAEAATFTASDLNYTNGGLGGCLIEGSATGVVTGEYTECGGEMSQTWTFTDDCGRTISEAQNITVMATPKAEFAEVENIEISCDQVSSVQPSYLSYSNGSTGACSISGEVLGVITGETNNCNGVLTQTWTFTDNCGRISTQTQTISIHDDSAPMFTAPSDITIFTDENCEYNISVEITGDVTDENDNCSTEIQAQFSDEIANGICSGSYLITRTWTLIDDCGNAASSQIQMITVLDNTAPVWTNIPQNLTVECDGTGNSSQLNEWLTGYTGVDNCGGDVILSNDYTSLSNLCGLTGSAEVTFTLSDECGNSTTETATFTIIDTQTPIINVPANITVNNDPGTCGAQVTLSVVNGTDDCGNVTVINNINGTNNASGFYEVGSTTINWTATDECGNTVYGQTVVTVTDEENPQILCPQNITINAGSGSCNTYVSIPAPIATDNCEIREITNTYSNTDDANGIYPVGTTIVTWIVTDNSGNVATCSTSVTVQDLEAPVITCPELSIVTNDPGSCGAQVIIPQPDVTDNCGVANYVNSFNGTDNASGYYPVGITSVTWTVTDIHNNTGTCIMNVIVEDNESPTIICPVEDLTFETNNGLCGADVVISKPVANDNCEIAIISNSYNGTDDASGFYSMGETTFFWTFTDIHGNSSTCETTVIIEDREAPSVICPKNIEITANENCQAEVEMSSPLATDNCSILSIENDYNGSDNASGIYEAGLTIVTWTVRDVNGNVTTCSVNVNVVAPIKAYDDNASTTINTPIIINVVENDTYCDDNIDLTTLISFSEPLNGSAMADLQNGSFIYTPNHGFHGIDTFKYRICDADGLCDEATVTVTISTPSEKLIARDDEYTTEINKQVAIENLSNDNYKQFIPVITILDQPQHGSLNLNSDNTITYTPETDFVGIDTYVYILEDANSVAIADTATTIITIVSDDLRDALTIYNVITPDMDGYNDRWVIEGIEEYSDNEVLIFNRWGDQVRYFENYDNNTIVWDGTNRNGNPLPSATYYYIVKLRSAKEIYTGWVVIHSYN